jgi:hypothetical protein
MFEAVVGHDPHRIPYTLTFLKIYIFRIYLFMKINIYKFHRQRNNCLLTYVALQVSTLMGHPQVLQVSYIRL